MNTKMGGAPWRIRVPLQGLMVAGFDVNHDVAMQNRSVGALVCSLDEQMTKFTSNVAFHENHSELGTNMEALFVSALKSYHKNNSAYPRRILFYRDGVGEGDVEPVRQLEIAGVLKAIEKLCPETRLKVVSVNKRIQTQFFREGPPGRAAAAMNPEPGTVIDDVVTNPEWVDFYLIPQSVREGTVNPVSYRTLHDDPRGFGFTSDQLQIITYVLCHAYFNWTGTVRVPAPCQYAHKLAFLTGQSLRRVHHRALSDKLFYL
ncbi:unnamed protein product [Notodromas monacha]|uniref:Piwi domain-containing protein n=1 Tax=Notodromas monacha TaxID=399045 RepID=A0A7R9GJR4_9CRUS|nr:unnamed protein product [Notodromas monacha]CAG0925140.1 unnamed protein product [Notodromas monacha]